MTEALKTVSSGFKLVYIGLLLVVLAVVIGIVGAMVLVGGAAAGGNVGGAAQMVVGLVIVVSGLAVTGKIIGLIGRFKCMAIPERAGGARQMIVMSVAMEVVSLLITVITLASALGGGFIDPQATQILDVGATILSLVAAVLFLLFTRSAAEFVRRPDLAAVAMSVLWLWVLTIGLYLAALAIVIAAGRAEAGCVGGLLMLAALIVGLVALIRYANLLTGMSVATLKYAREGAYGYDDEDYDDDRPRSRRGRSRARDEEEEEEEEEEDDRPRRKKRRDDDEWES